jgi:steroid 5-alpha reductase family enzyme
MNTEDRKALIAIPFAVLMAVGIAWAGSQGGYTAAGVPIFAIFVAVAFLINWLAFLPAYSRRTQAFYDLIGSITNITVILVSLLLTPVIDARSWLLAGIVIVWAARLGYFLVTRIRLDGEDRRFSELKQTFLRFLLAWTMQGLWVAFTLAAALAAITSMVKVPLDLVAFAGFLVWIFGFAIEVIADKQKRDFRAKPDNRDKFIHTGLWAWSRHPNYFGEILLWTGVAMISFPVLRGWQYVTLVSPVFVAILLTRISGIPMLETHADEKWGGQPDYGRQKSTRRLSLLKISYPYPFFPILYPSCL